MNVRSEKSGFIIYKYFLIYSKQHNVRNDIKEKN